jgi:hypothetical protein
MSPTDSPVRPTNRFDSIELRYSNQTIRVSTPVVLIATLGCIAVWAPDTWLQVAAMLPLYAMVRLFVPYGGDGAPPKEHFLEGPSKP